MKVLILGAAGMIGQRLAAAICSDGLDGELPGELVLHDITQPKSPEASFPVSVKTGNVADPLLVQQLAEMRPDLVFHLAAVVSGEAEAKFDKGWQINVNGGWALLEALRKEHLASGGTYFPRLIFASSIAVFGGPYPGEYLDDDFLCSPQSSYGAQKSVMELLLQDYSRKAFLDGMSLRLPTICVRPGRPNKAASSFFSGIIREPLNGLEAVLPVPDTIRHWFASPRSAVRYLLHAAGVDTSKLAGRRSLNLPGVSCTVAEQIEALRRVAGEDVVSRIRRVPDPDIMAIVGGWPTGFLPDWASALGFHAERDFEEIIRVYIEDELNG